MWLWLFLGICLSVTALDYQINPGCPTGYTGPNCANPICPSSSKLTAHDGSANPGDTIAQFISQTCGETFTIAVDNFMPSLYISVVLDSPNNFPTPSLYDPSGNIYPNDGEQYIGSQQMQVFYNLENAPRGLYALKVDSQQDGYCVIVASSTTSLTVDGGFIEDPRDDNVQTFDPAPNQGIARYPRDNIPSFLAFKVQNENYPTQAQSVRIFQDSTADQTFDVVARYNCSFPHITLQPFNCTVLNKYYAEFSGIDNSGNTWRRLYVFDCDAPVVTQPAPTGTPWTPPPATECLNGGTLTSSGTCYCGEFYEGYNCEWKLCMNGGTLNVGPSKCICASGWTGDNCQHVQCKTRSTDTFYRAQKALGFVVRSSSSMQALIPQIAQSALNITTTYRFFQVYILSVVQNNEVLFTRSYTDATSFVNAINGIIHPPTETVCSDSLLLGVNSVLDNADFQRYPSSPIYIFSDGVLNDGYETAGYFLQQATIYRPQLFFILADSANGMCTVDISSEGYQTLLGYAAFSQGLAVKSDIEKLAQTTDMITETTYESAILAQNDLLDCRQAPLYQPFFVDESITVVWITAIGENLTLTLTYPDTTTRTPTVYFFIGNLNIWRLDSPNLGTYMVNFKTRTSGAAECSYRVTANSAYNAYFGASSDMLTDIVNKEPVLNQDSHLVAKITNIYMPDPIDLSAELTLWTNDIQSGRVVLYSSSGLWRDRCNYELYFGSFQCTIPGMGFYASLYLTDFQGLTILRTMTGYCAASLPPSPGEQCQNGGATFNGTCVCPSHFSGTRCETIHCENQGTPKFGVCTCPSGFSGQFCEIIACQQTNNFIFTSPDYRSLTFLMHDSITTRSAFRTINDVASRIIHDIVDQHPLWLTNYQLLRFNDTYSETLVDGPAPEQFIQGINNAYLYNQNHSDYSCSNLDFYRTLLTALRDPNVNYGGIIYVFLYGIPRADSDSYDQIITHIEGSKVQINVVQFSANPCGQDYTKDGLMPLTQISGGSYYLSSGPNAGNIASSIPTGHSSGLIYERFVDNCADTTFYVPVDANTQSVTAYIQGELTTDPVYTKPDGKEADKLTVTNVWNDIGSDSRMDQLIQSCDQGWSLQDGHCFYFNGYPASWWDALTKCQSYGGTLATIYNAAEQNYLNFAGSGAKYWIGLNDNAVLNNWVWALRNNQSLPLNSTRYAPWNGGQPNGDTRRRCVLNDNQDGTGWNPTDCDAVNYFACSKNPYNSEFEPGDNVAKNYIQRGIWSVRVRADGPCSIFLRAQSTLQIVNLFTTNIHSDFGTVEPLQGTSSNRLIAHVTGLQPGTTHSLEYGHIYSDNGILLQAETIQHRDSSCTYDYLSTPFQCVNGGFQMMLTGVDNFGYMYQRVIPVLCLGAPDADSCENGGIFYDSACVCPPNFYGIHCEYVYCQNGGYPSGALGSCKCVGSFQGQFCEIPYCPSPGIVPDVSIDGRTFILALDGSSTGDMADVLANINSTLVTLLKGIDDKNPGWFTSYVAVVFRDSQVKDQSVFSSTIADTDYVRWAGNIAAELKANPYASKQTSRAIFAGLSQALSHNSVKENSFAFVLTNSKAEDTNFESMLLTTTAQTHSTIYFIFVGDKTAPGGGTDYTDPAVADLFEAAHNSGGSTYQISSNYGDNWLKIANSLYKSYTIISHHVTSCSAYTDYIQLGTNGTDVIIDIAQADPNVTVTDATGTSVNSLSVFTSKTNLLSQFSQDGRNPGIWGIKVQGTSNTCMFTVRGQSDLNVLAAFTQNVEVDGGMHDGNAIAFPRAYGEQNAVVATSSSGSSLTYVQILDIEEHSVVWASPLIKRALCSYGYISTQLFVCDRPSFILAVDGLDAIGHPFRRLLTYHCQGYIPPTNSPRPTTPTTSPPTTATMYPPCDPSVPKLDFIFVMDSSDDVGLNYFEILSIFDKYFFTFNWTNSRLLMGTYSATNDFFNNTLSSIQTEEDYLTKYLNLYIGGYTGLHGNNIDDFLVALNNDRLPKAPFRSDARKVVVFISSLGWDKGNPKDGVDQGYKDPTDSMNALKNNGTEFIPIGYGPNANLTQLKAFSSNCVQHAGSPDDFNNIVSFIAWKTCGSTPQC